MLKKDWIVYASVALLLIISLNSACNDSETGPIDAAGELVVTVQANYGQLKAVSTGIAKALDACPPTPVEHDGPFFFAGLDCDQDGGVVSFTTPESFTVAIKTLDIFEADGTVKEIVPDSGTLADALVVDLSTPVTLFNEEIDSRNYVGLSVEFYYYELAMPMNTSGAVETIRIYLSDDDFPAEGNLGHHQGDITIIGDDGVEAGWVQGCEPWTIANVQTDRSGANGAGGVDAETGHARGFFGNPDFWNAPAYMQGAGQDLFSLDAPLGLNIDGDAKTVTITFDLVNTWFFEDFDANALFNPGVNGEACSETSSWAPLFPGIDIDVE